MLNFDEEFKSTNAESTLRHFVKVRRRFMRKMSFMVFVITVMSVCIACKLGCFEGLGDSLSKSAETIRSMFETEQIVLQ